MTTPSICTCSIAAALALSFTAVVASAQTTATTVPVGFITTTVPAATVSGPSSTVASIPLYATAAFTSAATAVAANQVTLSGAAFTTSPPQFAIPAVAPMVGIANPHLLRIKTGANAGLFFAITGNTANTVTIATTASVPSLVGVLNVNDSCEIVPANTLGSVFGTSANPPTLAAGASTTADQVYLFSGAAWVPYYFATAGNYWKQSGNNNRDNTIIFPDDLVFIVRKSLSGPAVLTFMGTVPSTTEKSELPSGSSAFANRFPVNMTLGDPDGAGPLTGLGLETLPGWVAGNSTTADAVYLFNGTTWVKFYFSNVAPNANNWKQSGNAIRNSEPIPAASGVFIVRAGALQTLSQALPYTP